MNFLTDDTRILYRRFLLSSLGSALAMSVYSFVDTIAVGQSEGDLGSAAMAVISPLYGSLVFLAIVFGIGGAVLMSNAKGEDNEEKGNAVFTASLAAMGVVIAVSWIMFALFYRQIFTFFGADADLMPVVMRYAKWIIRFFPVFIVPTFISAFIRNDGAPGLCTAAVMAGGCLNIFGDWFLVFPMGMGMEGAAIATVAGGCLQVLIMHTHFFRKDCHLKLVRPRRFLRGIKRTVAVGFSSGILELGSVIIPVLMNNQIGRYGSNVELAAYGVLAAITPLFQALFSGVGQTIQPLVSVNYGAGNKDRVRDFWQKAFATAGIFGTVFLLLGELFPRQIMKLFVDASPAALQAAPGIFRRYFLLMLPLSLTVLSIYYLQAIVEEKSAVLISALRVALFCAAAFALPAVCGLKGLWLALPCSELFTAVTAVALIYGKYLFRKDKKC